MTRTGHGLEPLPDGGIRPVVPRNEPPSSRTSPHSTARSGIWARRLPMGNRQASSSQSAPPRAPRRRVAVAAATGSPAGSVPVRPAALRASQRRRSFRLSDPPAGPGPWLAWADPLGHPGSCSQPVRQGRPPSLTLKDGLCGFLRTQNGHLTRSMHASSRAPSHTGNIRTQLLYIVSTCSPPVGKDPAN